MSYNFLTPINMGGLEVLDTRVEDVVVLPTLPDVNQKQRLLYFNDELHYSNGVTWTRLAAAGTGGPPTGAAGGDLVGSYPNPQIAAGIIVNADISATADIAQSKIFGLTTSLSGKVATGTTLTAGAGMTGGGDLSTNRTFDVVSANSDMTVGLNDITINSAPKWTTGRTITLTGDVTGTSVAFDGTAGLSFITSIGSGVIVDGDVSGTANIQQSKILNLTADLGSRALTTTVIAAGAGLTGGGDLFTSRTLSVGAGTGITVNADDVALNTVYADGRYVLMGGATMTGPLVLSADPSAPLGAATKQYVDLTSQGFSFKNAVKCVSTTNHGVSGLGVIDGYTPSANDRVLLAGQTNPSQNGIWLAALGSWTRTSDMDASGELVDGTLVPIANGTVNGESQWMCTAIASVPWVPGLIGSTWTKFTSITDLSAGAGLVKTGTTIDVVSANSDLNVGADSITVVSAPKWTTGRTLTLTGDVTGATTAFDGSGNITLAATMVGTGAASKHFAGDVPGGTSVTITHNLGSKDVVVEVFKNSSPWDTVVCDVFRPTVNSVVLEFAASVSAAAYRCVVTGK